MADPTRGLLGAVTRGGYQAPPWAQPERYGPSGGATLGDLIGQRGQIQAQGYLDRANTFGQGVNQAAQAIAGYFGQKAERQEMDKREAATMAAVEGWDGKDPMQLYAGLQKIRPHDALQYTNTVLALHKGPQKDPEKELERFGKVAQFMKDQPDEVIARAWPSIRASIGSTAAQLGLGDAEQWDPKFRSIVAKAGEVFGPKQEARKLQMLSPGQVAIDEKTGEIIAKAPEKPAEKKLHALSPGQMLTDEAGNVVAKAPAAPREPKEDRVIPTQTTDPETGLPAQGFITESQARKMAASGGTIAKPEGAQVQNRMAAARSSIEAGGRVLQQLKEPSVAAQIGPVMGRYNSLAAWAGSGDPTAQKLVGEIKSFSGFQPGVHGFRATKFADDIEHLLTTKQTPESLSAGIQGILTASEIVAKQGGRGPIRPIADRPQPPKAGEVRRGYRYVGGDPAAQASWQQVK